VSARQRLNLFRTERASVPIIIQVKGYCVRGNVIAMRVDREVLIRRRCGLILSPRCCRFGRHFTTLFFGALNV
jgi:hypothetical protein